MSCVDEVTLHRYVSGELSEKNSSNVARHIRECSTCWSRLREVLALHSILHKAVDTETCVSVDDIEGYVMGLLTDDEKEEVDGHLATCEFCRKRKDALKNALPEKKEFVRRQQQRFRLAVAEEEAREAIEDIFAEGTELFQSVWEEVENFIEDRDWQQLAEVTSTDSPGQLAGTLGFAGEPSSRLRMVVLIVLTVALLEWEATSAEKKELDEVREHVDHIAQRLGAGRELRGRLCDAVPSIVIDSSAEHE